MTSKTLIQEFIDQKSLALVGISSKGHKFGNMAFRELKSKGYTVYPIHLTADKVEGVTTYKDFASLPEKVDGVLISVDPTRTLQVVQEAAAAGIHYIWMQQGSESQEAIDYCLQNGINVIHHECIMMYAIGTGIHGFHAWLWKILGKGPK